MRTGYSSKVQRGPGKTVLAAEAVRRAARSGHRVLFTCYNKLLAKQLKQSLSDEFDVDRVEVCTLHGLFIKMIERSSVVDEFNERKQEMGEQKVFDHLIPEYALFAAMEEVFPQFDFLVVDEAQDVLTPSVVAALSEIVKGGIEGGQWLVLLDSNNQASIYNRFDSALFERMRTLARSQFLTVNCRNTREVVHHTNLMAQPRISGKGRVDGPPVEFVSFASGKDPVGKLTEVLAQLRKAGIPGGRITVLLARVPEQRDQSRLNSLGLEPLRQNNVRGFGTGSATMWAVVSGFKGLENDVIVLVGIEDVASEWWKAVCYVGMSRARTRLYVLLTKECEQIRKQRWEAPSRRRGRTRPNDIITMKTVTGIRDKLLDFVRADLVGPAHGSERGLRRPTKHTVFGRRAISPRSEG